MENQKRKLPWEITKIIQVASSLAATGSSGASTGERIAAAFVLNRLEFLPGNYRDALEAWDRLEPQWQQYVRFIKRNYMHLIQGE
jgi:hypothetical protein